MPKHRLEQTAAMLKRERSRENVPRAARARHRGESVVLAAMADGGHTAPTPEPRPASSHVAWSYGAREPFGCCEHG